MNKADIIPFPKPPHDARLKKERRKIFRQHLTWLYLDLLLKSRTTELSADERELKRGLHRHLALLDHQYDK